MVRSVACGLFSQNLIKPRFGFDSLVGALRIYWTLKLFHAEFSVEAISNAGPTLSSNDA